MLTTIPAQPNKPIQNRQMYCVAAIAMYIWIQLRCLICVLSPWVCMHAFNFYFIFFSASSFFLCPRNCDTVEMMCMCFDWVHEQEKWCVCLCVFCFSERKKNRANVLGHTYSFKILICASSYTFAHIQWIHRILKMAQNERIHNQKWRRRRRIDINWNISGENMPHSYEWSKIMNEKKNRHNFPRTRHHIFQYMTNFPLQIMHIRRFESLWFSLTNLNFVYSTNIIIVTHKRAHTILGSYMFAEF